MKLTNYKIQLYTYNEPMRRELDKAFDKYPRRKFLPDDVVDLAEYDRPLPIGFGQTNSQPYTVERMLEWLDVQIGDNVLDVGSGSGWTTALLSYLTGKNGKVTAVEIVPELVEMGRKNCKKSGVKNANFNLTGKKFGWPKSAPYDRILVSASKSEVPKELIKQLEVGGRMVIPNLTSILVIDKDDQGELEVKEHPGFAFVPLVKSKV